MSRATTDGSVELARMLAWIGRRTERALRDLELTPKEYGVLALLAEGSAGSSALADLLWVSRPRVTALADRLEERGFITRAPEEGDRRRVAHRLTDAGIGALEAADAALAARVEDLLARLDGPARADAERGLRHLAIAVADARAERRATVRAERENATR